MRYVMMSVAALAAVPVAAQEAAPAPTSAWEFFEADGGRSGASVKAADGTQLVLKCDKPGSREVHAILLSPNDKLAVPNQRPISRPITFQFDGKAPKTESWGFYTQYAIAQGMRTTDRTLAHFISGLKGASQVKMRLDTGIGPDVTMDFNVAGSQEAITRVYEMCKDSVPS